MINGKSKLVFHLIDIPTSKEPLRVAYIDYLNHWRRNKLLSGRRVDIPLELQYHLHIMGEISDHIFEIVDSKVTDRDFIKAGFVKSKSFSDFIKENISVN